MANRKVLINRHTSGNTAPNAAEMFHGEIAVAHETGKETLWTKNNANEMVPFISCAQTISIVSGMIEDVNVVYNVSKKDGEPYINVETATTQGQKTFTLSTSGVQSEEEFKAYSAATNSALTALTDAFGQLLDVTVTGITGDTIITATPVENGTGSNGYNLTHKAATAVTGFNKLDTDAYGHVTAATPVAASDIEALGFQTSAETGEEINAVSGAVDTFSAATVAEFDSAFTAINNLSADTEAAIDQVYDSGVSYTDSAITVAIEALDSSISASTTGKYLTAISIKDGMLDKIEEADIPVLEVESAGTGNVVSQITVEDHKITYTTTSVATSTDIQNLSAATINLSAATTAISENLETLSGAVEDFSGFTDAKFTALSAGTIQLSADTKAAIAALSAGTIQLSADTKAAIDELAGKAVTSVTFNGVEKVANNVATLVETKLSSASTGDGNVITDIAVNDHEITFTKGITALTGVSVTGDNYITGTVASNSAITLASDVATDIANVTTGDTKLADALAVKNYVEGIISSSVNYKGATGATPASAAKGDLYIANADFTIDGKNVETGDFIIYDGNKWDVIEKNLDGAITGNLTANTVTLGNGVNEVTSLAAGTQGQVLMQGASAPEWADLPVLASAETGTGNVVTSIAVSDHTITYNKGLTVATDADLKTLSGMVETISGYTDAKFTDLSGATQSISGFAHGEIVELSGAVKANETNITNLSAGTIALVGASAASVYSSGVSYTNDKVAEEIGKLNSVGSASTTGHYITSVTISSGLISAIGEEEVPAATPVTTVNGATGNTATAVLNGIYTGGTDGHQLTLSATNKIFSAETSDSAVTSQSAITSQSAQTSVSASMAYELSSAATITSGQVTDFEEGVKSIETNSATTAESAQTSVSATVATDAVHASAATKVDSALTMTDGTNSQTYDGSANKTLTFGKAVGSIGNSMSMDANGVVDVEVIDCGEY